MDFVSHFLNGVATFAVIAFSIINPFSLPTKKIVVSPTPTPVVIEQPSFSPTPTYIPTQPTVKPTVYIDPDPIVNCNISSNCGGGARQMKRSECNNSVCCQIRDKWILYKDSNQCDKDQSAVNQQTTGTYVPTIITPTITPTYNSGYNPPSLINCVVSYPCNGQSFNWGLTDSTTCSNAQQSAISTCNSIKSTQNNNNASLYQQCRDNITTQYNSVMAQLSVLGSSDSSAAEAAASAKSKGLTDCAQRYSQ